MQPEVFTTMISERIVGVSLCGLGSCCLQLNLKEACFSSFTLSHNNTGLETSVLLFSPFSLSSGKRRCLLSRRRAEFVLWI